MSAATPPVQNGKTVWSFLTGSAPTIALAFGALWAVMSMQLSSELGPVKAEQAISRTERGETRTELLRERDLRLSDVGKLQEEFRSLKEEVVALKASTVEVETQFRSEENSTNLMRADQLRFNGIIWREVFGTEYPSAAFYPSIARPK